ncbi:DUF4426 domain-containing protein [Aliikangiella maris]|uniref:DUF4426 domain-containing protein n=2 Tax=Aliikangiella maris TaxID=3162458 RepID=A0ABV3MUD2_9GAMM
MQINIYTLKRYDLMPQHCVKHYLSFLFALTLLVFSPLASTTPHTIGDITIHYNALSSSNIPPEVASQYGITRSQKTGIINISVQKNGKPVIANIFGHGKNLAGQLKELAFKEIKEDNAIYYIAAFNFSNAEKLSFDLQVQPEKQGILIPLQFKQQLFAD